MSSQREDLLVASATSNTSFSFSLCGTWVTVKANRRLVCSFCRENIAYFSGHYLYVEMDHGKHLDAAILQSPIFPAPVAAVWDSSSAMHGSCQVIEL